MIEYYGWIVMEHLKRLPFALDFGYLIRIFINVLGDFLSHDVEYIVRYFSELLVKGCAHDLEPGAQVLIVVRCEVRIVLFELLHFFSEGLI